MKRVKLFYIFLLGFSTLSCSSTYVTKSYNAINNNQNEKAIIFATKAIQMNPKQAMAYNNRGAAYNNLGKYEEAISDFNMAIKLNPLLNLSYYNRGFSYGELKKYNLAISDYTKSIEMNCNIEICYYNRGFSYGELEKYDLAISDFTMAIELNYDKGRSYLYRGVTYERLKKHNLAISDYSMAIELNYDKGRSYSYRGYSYHQLKKYDLAISDYLNVIDLNQNSSLAYTSLAWNYFLIGQYDDCLINSKRAVSIDPKNVVAICNIANSYWKLGKIEEAEINFTKALKMSPNHPDILFDRGDFYRGINRDAEALRDYHAFFGSKDKKTTDEERIKEVQQWMASLNKESEVHIVNKQPISSPAASSGLHWAVIIGVSKYKDTQITPLRYASKDAKAFYNWLISPSGGKYSTSQVKLITDEKATYQNIREALFVWLQQALEEDVVTFYFAGHGSPESPDRPDNLFFLPYDTQYDNIATTAFPMWDIETALKRFIKAKKVVVLADACHSGGIGQSYDIARKANRGIKKNTISTGFQNLSQIGDGVCVISASEEDQYSQEGQQWGGGHGVFTHTILEGLKGNADYNSDSYVSLGELIPYLSQTVRRETRNAQSPTVSGKFDPALSIAR